MISLSSLTKIKRMDFCKQENHVVDGVLEWCDRKVISSMKHLYKRRVQNKRLFKKLIFGTVLITNGRQTIGSVT